MKSEEEILAYLEDMKVEKQDAIKERSLCEKGEPDYIAATERVIAAKETISTLNWVLS